MKCAHTAIKVVYRKKKLFRISLQKTKRENVTNIFVIIGMNKTIDKTI